MPRDLIVEDYALSAGYFARPDGRPAYRRLACRLDRGRQPPGVHGVVPRHLDERHGGAAGLLRAHGMTDEELAALVELITEPVTETPISRPRAPSWPVGMLHN